MAKLKEGRLLEEEKRRSSANANNNDKGAFASGFVDGDDGDGDNEDGDFRRWARHRARHVLWLKQATAAAAALSLAGDDVRS